MGDPPGSLERHTFLVERPLGKRVTLALREYGLSVVAFTDHFEDAAPDEEWIARAASEGWVVLTKDAAVRRRRNERLAIKTSGLRVFALTRGTWKSEEMSNAFIAALRRIERVLRKTPGPFVARITKAGEISLVDDLSEAEEK